MLLIREWLILSNIVEIRLLSTTITTVVMIVTGLLFFRIGRHKIEMSKKLAKRPPLNKPIKDTSNESAR
jgi:hypothetical protein